MRTVHCRDCGLLAFRNENREIIEANELARESGVDGAFWPLCSAMAIDMWQQIREVKPQPDDQWILGTSKVVIDKPRHCAAFVKWMPNFSPKEHRQMQIDYMDSMREARRDWLIAFVGVVGPLVGVILGTFLTPRTTQPIVVNPTPINIVVPNKEAKELP